MRKATIKDIAKQFGVNPSTVSRALKDHPDISPSLRADIKKLAEQLNYRPNHMAVYLRRRTSRLIGLIIPEVIMFFYPSVIKGVEEVLHEEGYSLIMLPSYDSVEREIENIQICVENDVAGLLIAVTQETQHWDHLSVFEDAGLPVVMLDKVIDDAPFDAVVLEDYHSAAMAVEHLVATGCRRIVGLFGKPKLRITQLRLKAFKQTLQQHGLPNGPETFFFADNTSEAEERAQTILEMSPRPDAIFAMSDELITGALPVLVSGGLKIPEECSIIGISDGFLPYYMYPQVSFMLHAGYEVGRQAALRLSALIKSGEHLKSDYTSQRIVVKTRLIELASTKTL